MSVLIWIKMFDTVRVFLKEFLKVKFVTGNISTEGFFNSLPTNLCHLLITFANILDQKQAQQNVSPDMDQNV